MTSHPAEAALREKLGIPPDARRVLVFGESSHWDPNWLWTSTDYFRKLVRPNLDKAIRELQNQPRRVYSVECVFFLRMYWDARPDQHEAIRELVGSGQLRMTSSGVTTADTILPSTEALLRDLLSGQEWLREHGLNQEPRLAYFTDSFGMSPALPSLLNAAGFDRTAFTRIDGMYFAGCDYEPARNFPRPGSTTERLTNVRTTDFVWRDMNGAEVLAHWNAFNYGQGDMLAHRGVTRMYVMPFLAIPARSDRSVARRIESFAARLFPMSRTPYAFCPIGLDFVAPLDDLVGLLDRYNENHSARTGVWAVNAGLDDYLALIEPYRAELPVLEMDPNPYWTGFYTARPLLKQRAYELTSALLHAEELSVQPANLPTAGSVARELAPAWWQSATSNHHDFITGTSPDRVIYGESFPLLDAGLADAASVIRRLQEPPGNRTPARTPAALPEYRKLHDGLTVTTGDYVARLSAGRGGTIVSLTTPEGEPLVTGPSHDLVAYEDSGGLWRMGMEFRGGRWKRVAAASDAPAELEVEETDEGLAVRTTHVLTGETIRRTLWFRADSPYVRGRVHGRAAAGFTITARLRPASTFRNLHMDAAGGVVGRPPSRVFHPTFWAFQHFAHLESEAGASLAVVQKHPGAVAVLPEDRAVELVALRNATRETAWRLLPILANPASGRVRDAYGFEYAVAFTRAGDWRANRLHRDAVALFAGTPAPAVCETDSADVTIAAVKPASRGEGVIVRLVAPAAPGVVRLVSHAFAVRSAALCDARERDLGELAVDGGVVTVAMTGTIATVRLVP